LYADFIPLDDSIYIASDLLTDASVVVPASGGGSSSPQFPGITWDPNDLVSGDPITVSKQLDAVFSVPGSAVYSAHPGDVPAVGTLNIRVTFTPADTTNYFAISTTKSIRISPKPTPSPSARSGGGGGSAPSPSATPTSSPSPSASPSPSPSPSASASPSPSPVVTSPSKPDKLPTPNSSPSPAAPTTQKPKTVSFTSLRLVGVIHFNNNEYFLDQGDRKSLVSFSKEIAAASPTQIIVQGNTDIKAGVDNVWLSKARAEAVSKYLAPLLSKSIVISAWFASKKPVAIGIDKVSLAKNRRVDIYALVTTASPAPNPQQSEIKRGSVEESYQSISFNRNEYFLDAADRKSLVESVQNMAKLGCTQVYLKGSHDKTKSSVNAYIGANRVNAVKKFMAGLLPTLKFSIEPEFVSADRVVQIRCTN
jgi:outer membrane protein OmpA-like peptidoglycan-associated protein